VRKKQNRSALQAIIATWTKTNLLDSFSIFCDFFFQVFQAGVPVSNLLWYCCVRLVMSCNSDHYSHWLGLSSQQALLLDRMSMLMIVKSIEMNLVVWKMQCPLEALMQ
jgi:hypothetical protein